MWLCDVVGVFWVVNIGGLLLCGIGVWVVELVFGMKVVDEMVVV